MRIFIPKMFGCGESSIKLNTKFTVLLILFFFVAFIFLVVPSKHHRLPKLSMIYEPTDFVKPYNATYPFTGRVIDEQGFIHMKLALISDPDRRSKKQDGKTWTAKLQFAELILDAEWRQANFVLRDSCEIETHFSFDGRGCELSELIAYNGKFYTIDDRTGIVYELILRCPDPVLIPWLILSDGAGNVNRGFKGEWLAVKDEILYVGSMGKAFTDAQTGEVINLDPFFVKAVSHTGQVQHLDWKMNFDTIASAISVGSKGYLIHEAVAWSQHHKQWFFLPRKESSEPYNDVTDEEKGTNVVIRTSASFTSVRFSRLQSQPIKRRGFSTFKFVPHTNDLIIIGIKTKEYKDEIGSYVTVFDTSMNPLLEELEISSSEKFEGLEFI